MQNRHIVNWLFFTAFMVFAMAIIGAITRLTESGLSIVEWRPLVGSVPPLSEAEWNRVFALYQGTPEYNARNYGISLAEFKSIFFWEWIHRVWGRLIGLVYAIPLAYFWLRKRIPDGYTPKLLIGLVLGGLQGVMGWYMVASGLVDRPSISHFRLAAHLGLAFAIFAYLLWLAFELRDSEPRTLVQNVPTGALAASSSRRRRAKPEEYRGLSRSGFCTPDPAEGVRGRLGVVLDQRPRESRPGSRRHAWITLGCIALTIVWGAFVAGLDAGLVYGTWPKMGPHWLPPEITAFTSILFEPVGVQFTHRWIAILTALVVLSFAYRVRSLPLAGMVLLQVGLGRWSRTFAPAPSRRA